MENQIDHQEEKIKIIIDKVKQFEEEQAEADRNAEKLNELYKAKIIDEHGNPLIDKEVE